MTRPNRLRLAAAVVALLSVAAAYESANVAKLLAKQSPDPYGIEVALARFSPLAARLPRAEVLGYLSDLPPGDRAHLAFLQAQYALAPRLLVPLPAGEAPQRAVGNFSNPLEASKLAAAHGYQVEEDLGAGVALLKRKIR